MAKNCDSNNQQQLPIDGEGVCMLCKKKPNADQVLACVTCITPWHVECLSVLPETLARALDFECPDCSGDGFTGAPAPPPSFGGELVAKIREIEADEFLSEHQKAKKRQQLLSGKGDDDEEEEEQEKKSKAKEAMDDVLALLSDSFKCSFCMQLPERPVTV